MKYKDILCFDSRKEMIKEVSRMTRQADGDPSALHDFILVYEDEQIDYDRTVTTIYTIEVPRFETVFLMTYYQNRAMWLAGLIKNGIINLEDEHSIYGGNLK